jgi:RNA polymerase sigma-70 factor (ECF subfamily)
MDADLEEMMGPAELEQRLSGIATQWTAVFQAHGSGDDTVVAARNRLMLRYSGAVYRYLLGAVRDPDTAGDLCQEFAVKFLRGDFRRAAPERGRFRDYVKTALVNLVNDYFRTRQAAPKGLIENASAPSVDQTAGDFEGGWRTELLEQTWKALAEANPTFFATLRLRVEDPDLPSGEMAERLTQGLGREISAENVRKTIQRAHAKFADLMLDLVAESLDQPAPADLEEELKALDLLRYCRTALDRRREKS